MIFFSSKGLALLSSLIFLSNSMLDANSLPVRVGPPIKLSPAINPDPVLQNLGKVMDNFYQPPYYPGGSPDYLSQIYYLPNYYVQAPAFVINPLNDQIMLNAVGQNWFVDRTFTYILPGIATNTLMTSLDGGNSWSSGPPVATQIIPLGGSISQLINSSLGPGLTYQYTKNGTLYAAGWGFQDMVPNPPRAVPCTGFLFSRSDDNGKNWTPPSIVLTSSHAFTLLQPGIAPREFYITAEPDNPDIIHASTMTENWPLPYGNLYYMHSENAGKTFSQPRLVYSIINDPVWKAKNFVPDFPDPNYFIYGGWSLSSGFPVIYDKNVILLPLNRAYPLKGFTTFSSLPPDSANDQAIVKSLDGGKTWLKVAGTTDQYLFPVGPYDPGFLDPSVPVLINGYPTFGYLLDDATQSCSPLVSPTTGRLYLTYAASNPASSSDFNTLVPYTLLSVSSDQGSTFSKAVQINATPKNIPIRAQMTISGNAVFTQDGYYVVAYYDFRNWTGFPGEIYDGIPIADFPPLPCDAWLAVYKEMEDPMGGSTGVGLDFVGEIRLTPESFNGRNICIGTSIPYIVNYATGGSLEGVPMAVNKNNELFVGYSMTHPGSPSNITIGYKGMTIDANSYVTLYVQKFKFPKASNQ